MTVSYRYELIQYLDDRSATALFCIQKGKYEQGALMLEELVSITGFYGAKAEWWFDEGICRLMMGNYDRAEQCFTICLDAEHRKPLAMYFLAVIKVMGREPDRAQAVLKTLLEQYSDFVPGWYLLGLVLRYYVMDLSKAAECFKKVIWLRSEFGPAYHHLCSILYCIGQPGELEYYQRFDLSHVRPAP